MRKFSLFLLCIFLLAACEKEDLTQTYITIDRATPKSGTELAADETVYIAVKYNIAPDVLEVDGFYIQHYYKYGGEVMWTKDISRSTKRITARNGSYGHTFSTIGFFPVMGNDINYQVRLLRKDGTNLSAISFSNELYYKLKK